MKAKEQEEKEVIAQQVISFAILFPALVNIFYLLWWSFIEHSYLIELYEYPLHVMFSLVAEYVCSVVASCFARTTNAWNGRRLCPSPSNGWIGDASNAPFRYATHGQQLLTGKRPWTQMYTGSNVAACFSNIFFWDFNAVFFPCFYWRRF